MIQVHDCCIDVHYSCANKSVFLLTTFTVAIKSQSRLLHDFSNASAIPADRLSQQDSGVNFIRRYKVVGNYDILIPCKYTTHYSLRNHQCS